MHISEILKGIERNRGFYPRKEIEAAIQSKDEIIPELLNVLTNLNQNYEELCNDDNYSAHIFAMYILAQFRVKEAYPLICEFFSIPGEITLEMFGDFVTEDLGKVLATVAKGDDSLIKKLIEDDNVNEYVRSAALKSLVVMVVEGEKTREEVIEYFSELFKFRLERKRDYIFSALVCSSIDLFPEELLDDIKKAFDDDLIETFTVGFEDVEKTIKQGKEKTFGRLTRGNQFRLVSDTIKETEWWPCFHAEMEPKISTGLQVVNYDEFVGRNNPCPCKSGKKYKKCCGRN